MLESPDFTTGSCPEFTEMAWGGWLARLFGVANLKAMKEAITGGWSGTRLKVQSLIGKFNKRKPLLNGRGFSLRKRA